MWALGAATPQHQWGAVSFFFFSLFLKSKKINVENCRQSPKHMWVVLDPGGKDQESLMQNLSLLFVTPACRLPIKPRDSYNPFS
jgi:hypothetical protein